MGSLDLEHALVTVSVSSAVGFVPSSASERSGRYLLVPRPSCSLCFVAVAVVVVVGIGSG